MKKYIIITIIVIIIAIVMIVPSRPSTIIRYINENWKVDFPMADMTLYETSDMVIDGYRYEVFYYKDRSTVEKKYKWHKISEKEIESTDFYFDELGVIKLVKPDYENTKVYVKKDLDDTLYIFCPDTGKRIMVLEVFR